MKFRRFAVAFVCLLAVVGVAGAQQVCSPYMASGTYLMSLSGWATVAVNPMPIHVPIAVQGIVKVDDSGALTGVGPTISVAAGTPTVLTMTASNVTIAGDCTLTFKATCVQGCQWEGQGYFLKSAKEMSILFTKAVGDSPLTISGTLKQISN